MLSERELQSLLQAVTDIADRAGDIIIDLYDQTVTVRQKADSSPVTEADEKAELLILDELSRLSPNLPAISEEAASRGQAPATVDGPFWLVDPLDGTREFVNRNGEFTVNIALVDDHRPILGVVLAPARKMTYRAARGQNAEKRCATGDWQPIRARPVPEDGVVVVSSRSHGDREQLETLLSDQQVARHEFAGSSLKFCLVADGTADLYPRYGPTSEWDTAAGHAVLAIAGGSVQTIDGDELTYGKSGWLNPGFIARGIA